MRRRETHQGGIRPDTVQGMRGKVPTPLSLFECHCVLRHKPIMRFWLPQKTLFGPSVTEAALSAAQADTFHSLASGLCTVTARAAAAVGAAWREDIFTVSRLSSVVEAVCVRE